jgi:diguanylate cyclase (GGDEF) domain
MKVLLVSEMATCSRLEPLIRAWGYEVTATGDAEATWQAIRNESRPVLAVLDRDMPSRAGLDLCSRLKSEKALSQLYIILLTASYDGEAMSGSLDAYADDYTVKPVQAAELRARLAIGRRILEYQNILDNLSHELQDKNKELGRRGTLDGLTGIPGRPHFSERLRTEWRRALRESAHLSLILINLDFFKDYNSTYGHVAGDECLKKIARTIAAAIARPGDLAARFGGEEFAVLLPNTDKLGTLVVAESIRVAAATLAIEHKTSTIHRYLTVSIGTATVVPDEDTIPETLIAKADEALYQAKQAGRNVVKQAP